MLQPAAEIGGPAQHILRTVDVADDFLKSQMPPAQTLTCGQRHSGAQRQDHVGSPVIEPDLRFFACLGRQRCQREIEQIGLRREGLQKIGRYRLTGGELGQCTLPNRQTTPVFRPLGYQQLPE